MILKLTIPAAILTIAAAAAIAATSQVKTTTSGNQRCIVSNGIPDHSTGRFPNSGNPHRIKEQNTRVCIPLSPKKSSKAKAVDATGIALNGVLIRPSTAEYYDPNSRRGYSQRPVSNWRVEGMFSGDKLGFDRNNAHVDKRGLYHYHGVPPTLVGVNDDTQIGWAADGFPIHYIGDQARPGYMLKSGNRPTGSRNPGGAYDGEYIQDWEFERGLGNLDQCNGAVLGGEYVYFVTDTYPFYPRCLYGTEITKIH